MGCVMVNTTRLTTSHKKMRSHCSICCVTQLQVPKKLILWGSIKYLLMIASASSLTLFSGISQSKKGRMRYLTQAKVMIEVLFSQYSYASLQVYCTSLESPKSWSQGSLKYQRMRTQVPSFIYMYYRTTWDLLHLYQAGPYREAGKPRGHQNNTYS